MQINQYNNIIIAVSTIAFFLVSLLLTAGTGKEVQDGYWKIAILRKLTAIQKELELNNELLHNTNKELKKEIKCPSEKLAKIEKEISVIREENTKQEDTEYIEDIEDIEDIEISDDETSLNKEDLESLPKEENPILENQEKTNKKDKKSSKKRSLKMAHM